MCQVGGAGNASESAGNEKQKPGKLFCGKVGTQVEVINLHAKNYIAIIKGIVSTGETSSKYLVQFISGDKELREASVTYPYELVESENLCALSQSSGNLKTGSWKVGLFDVTAAPGGTQLCLLTCCCPSIGYSQTMGKLDPKEFTCGGNQCGACLFALVGGVFATASTRYALRRKFDIPGSLPEDCLVHACCPLCALIQVTSELPLDRDLRSEPSPERPRFTARSTTTSRSRTWGPSRLLRPRLRQNRGRNGRPASSV